VEQVGNDGNEAETIRCEPDNEKFIFHLCSIMVLGGKYVRNSANNFE